MTAGRALVGRLGQETELGPGEAARWVSDAPHGYTAVGADPVDLGPGHPVPDRLAAGWGRMTSCASNAA